MSPARDRPWWLRSRRPKRLRRRLTRGLDRRRTERAEAGEAAKTVEQLIAELDSDDGGIAEEAQASLQRRGRTVLPPLVEAAPTLGRLGQLCAIEVFESFRDPSAGTALIPMLRSEYDTVREWAARALGTLGIREAVPALEAGYSDVKRRRVPLDWMEPQALLGALTKLGARTEVVPPRVRELERTEENFGRCWCVIDLPEVIDALADARQVLIPFDFWKRGGASWYWVETAPWPELDWSLPWDDLVESARTAAQAAVARAPSVDLVARPAWVDEADRDV